MGDNQPTSLFLPVYQKIETETIARETPQGILCIEIKDDSLMDLWEEQFRTDRAIQYK